MSQKRTTLPPGHGSNHLPGFLLIAILVIVGIAFWQSSSPLEHNSPNPAQSQFPRLLENRPDENEPSLADLGTEPPSISQPVGQSDLRRKRENQPADEVDASRYKIENQTIRDQSGKIVFKGTIDLTPTLDRIERHQANQHRHDGTTFQNREGRLPNKHAGYYKEYVHPTAGEKGPGPQRIIIGRDGDIWYTPDHYRTFREIRSAKN